MIFWLVLKLEIRYNRVIRKARKTQHEFGHTQGEIQKKPRKTQFWW
jgi:hypothetical protein